MKKYDLEHIVKSKLERRTVNPPAKDWSAIQKALPKKTPFFSKMSTWLGISTLVIATGALFYFSSISEKVDESIESHEIQPEPIIRESLEASVLDSTMLDEKVEESPSQTKDLKVEPEVPPSKQIKEKVVPLKPKITKSETKDTAKIKKEPKVIRIVETDTLVTQEHIYR